MKKSILYPALALLLTATGGCTDSFLTIDPAGAVSETTLTTPDGVDMLLTGAYASVFNNNAGLAWMGYGSISNWVYGDVVGADANKGSQSTDQSDFTQLETYQFNSANSYLLGKWSSNYEGVKRCNNVLDLAEQIQDQLPDYEQIVAQAKFLKGVCMFELIKMFGAAVPYITLEDYRSATDPLVSNVDESGNYIYVWNLVAQDMKEAMDALPETWPESEKGRVNKWAAAAMLAKLYMYWSSPYNGTNGTEDHWAEAKALLKDVIDKGVDSRGQKFRLADDYYTLFRPEGDWSGESVLDAQTTISGTQTYTNTPYNEWAVGLPGASGVGGWGFYQPTYDFVNSFIVDENGLPEADYQSLPTLTNITSGVINSDLTTATDPRLDITIGRFGVPYLDWGTPIQSALSNWVRDYTNGGPYMNKKPQPLVSEMGSTSVSTVSSSSAKNYHVIRYADVLLLYAECCIHDGDLETAREMINQVRMRAANSYVAANETTQGSFTFDDKVNGKTVSGTAANYRLGLYTTPFASAEEATKALKRERRAELGMEGHRWFDLARWGEVGTVLNNFVTYENQYLNKYSAYDSKWVMFPIPNSEIQTAEGRIVQNASWK